MQPHAKRPPTPRYDDDLDAIVARINERYERLAAAAEAAHADFVRLQGPRPADRTRSTPAAVRPERLAG
jgi:hypothetical protein